MSVRGRVRIIAAALTVALAGSAMAQRGGGGDFPPFSSVSEGYTRVVSTAEDRSMWTVWIRERDAQMLAELPRDFEGKRFFIVPTVAGGDAQAGVHSTWHPMVRQGARQVYWSRRDNRLALIEPNMSVRTSGDAESRRAAERVYTDRVLLSVPILTMGPGGGPVIDLDQLLVAQSDAFFGAFTRGADRSLTRITSAKAFPQNIEITIELPRAGGRLASVHYSIGTPPKSRGFRTLEADRRVGFFYTDYVDRSVNDGETQTRRLAHRWHLEKRDPSLALSPPKQPIIFYIEHTTPVRYRRWVRDALLAWNRAFEQVGILDAIEVRQQDAQTGAYMDLDPEDIRYSFVRWTNSHMGFAIGPIHVHPDTGEIYEADIVMDEVFIAGWAGQFLHTELARAAMLGFNSETVSWLNENPEWDPRFRLASPEERQEILAYHRMRREGTVTPDDVPAMFSPEVWSEPDLFLASHGGTCACVRHMSMDVQMMRAAFAVNAISLPAAGPRESVLDGMPESFIGPLVKWVVMHEVGHTLGLTHNWKGSSIYAFDEINSEEIRGVRPHAGSVMDYAPVNVIVEDGELVQGDWAMNDIGPYDMWAIRWGYSQRGHDEIASEATNPLHAFTSDEGQGGPDPHAKVWDMGENSLDFADARIALAGRIRERIIEDGVSEGESWQKARTLYATTLSMQLGALSTASNWIGGAHVNRYRKGDPDATDPVVPVAVDRQRRAIEFIIQNGLNEHAWGATPELLSKLTSDQWWDERSGQPDWPVHDQILGYQASAMTMLLDPTRLRRILDNELRVGADADALTIPELLDQIREHVWRSPEAAKPYSNRSPMLSTMQRNLQREHLDRLIHLSVGSFSWAGVSTRTLSMLARQELREIQGRIAVMLTGGPDDYTRAHLTDALTRIERALEAGYQLAR